MMRYILPVFLWMALVAPPVFGEAVAADTLSSDNDSIEELLKEANEMHMSGKEEKSLELYEEVLEREETNLDALWNAAVLYSKKGYRKDSEDKMEEMYTKALNLSERALEHHGDDGYAFYAYAVSKARMTEVMGRRNKIRASKEIKENLEKAVDRLTDFAPVWHLFGVWHSDVANVSRAEKAAARLISGGLPDASNENAEKYLKKAVEMDEDNILFRLDLAKHYLEVDNNDAAREQLQQILELDPKMQDDPMYKEEAEKLLDEID